MTEQTISEQTTDVAGAVLFVDDDRRMLDGLNRVLQDAPFQSLFATNAGAAFAILAETRVDVVVADEVMPLMSGSELLRCVRMSRPFVRRILWTGTATLQTAARAISVGEVFAYLTKPCDFTVVCSMIAEALRSGNRESSRCSRLSARDSSTL